MSNHVYVAHWWVVPILAAISAVVATGFGWVFVSDWMDRRRLRRGVGTNQKAATAPTGFTVVRHVEFDPHECCVKVFDVRGGGCTLAGVYRLPQTACEPEESVKRGIR